MFAIFVWAKSCSIEFPLLSRKKSSIHWLFSVYGRKFQFRLHCEWGDDITRSKSIEMNKQCLSAHFNQFYLPSTISRILCCDVIPNRSNKLNQNKSVLFLFCFLVCAISVMLSFVSALAISMPPAYARTFANSFSFRPLFGESSTIIKLTLSLVLCLLLFIWSFHDTNMWISSPKREGERQSA